MAALGDSESVVLQGELPPERNRRGGPGWWMDLDGIWRAPEEWPEDVPPLSGWVRGVDGRWGPPDSESIAQDTARQPSQLPAVLVAEAPPVEKRISRQAQSDRRAILIVMGVLGAAAILLAGAIILITQAGAEVEAERPELPGVIYAAETDEVRAQRQRAAAALAPEQAVFDLAQLPVRDGLEVAVSDGVSGVFDPQDWTVVDDGCLDLREVVLVERSQVPITWADQLECVPDGGRWVDRNLGTTLNRVHEADVVLLVPAQVVFASGGSMWSTSTQQAYLSDQLHPATLQIVAAGAGNNPRGQDPSAWRPASQQIWCAYAVDWISVKSHWQLDVSADEKLALEEMLATCDEPSSRGADPETVLIDTLVAPQIETITAAGQ